jgi:aryl-alcohol dehydrogenase-like predicted oxidoreductase
VKTRLFGQTGLSLSVLGLGTWAMGGADWAYGWGPQSESDSEATIRRALELGINWIDTAPVYGLGRAEEIVARALAPIPDSARPFVFTKCGLVWDKKKRVDLRLGTTSIRREAEQSLRRLGVQAIDLYQIHWPNDSTIIEAWRTLVALKEEGKVRHIGVSNFDVRGMKRLGSIAPVESLQPPYSLARREIEREVLPYCVANGIGVIVYSPLESGLLSGGMSRERIEALPDSDWRKRKGEGFQEPKLTRNLELAEKVKRAAARRGAPPGAVAVAWTLKHPAVTGAIVGARRPEQIDELVKASEIELADDELESAQPSGSAQREATSRGGGVPAARMEDTDER